MHVDSSNYHKGSAPLVPPQDVLGFRPILRNIAHVTEKHGALLGEMCLRVHILYVATKAMELSRDYSEVGDIIFLSEFRATRAQVSDFLEYLVARADEMTVLRNG